ncbi:MAG: LamG domain-containing protein [Angelakisella sp.]|jgi:hypothetical protein|nr:LamG domain-containing protein [Angelakisella sp.]
MSVQRRTFFALKCERDYWAELPAIPEMSLCGGTPFTLGASFWYPYAGDDNILLQQEGVFTFGVKDGCVHFTAKNLGSFRADASREPKLLENEWNRADVVYDGTGVRIYIQGILALEATLPAEKLKAYADVAPYRFEEHLSALWLFSDQYPTELITGAVLTYSSGTVGSALRENTVLDREPPALSFYMPDIPTQMDEVETWETRVAAEAILQGMEALTGMEPSGGFVDPGGERLNGSMATLVAQYARTSPQITTLENSGKFTGDDLQEVFAAASLGAFLGAVCYGFYCSARNGSLRRAMLGRRFLHFFKMAWKVSNWPAIGSALAAGAAKTVRYFGATPAPDSGTCTNKDYDVTFRSLTFYHEGSRDAGALFGLPDFGGSAVLPEWSRTESGVTSAPALYHRDIPTGKTPSLLLCFHCDKKCDTPVEITFSAACLKGNGLDDVLGEPSAGSVTVTATGDYSVTLPLPGATTAENWRPGPGLTGRNTPPGGWRSSGCWPLIPAAV